MSRSLYKKILNLLLIAWIGEEDPVLLTVAVGVVVPSSLKVG